MGRKYDEAAIERFAGLAGIRKKPTVYVGTTDSHGLWTIFREPADNAVDQALAKRNKSVHLILDKEPNTYWVVDSGEGIPVGEKTFTNEHGKKEKLSTLYVTTGLTHGGSNFTSDNISRGTHGLGIKATNALSDYFQVWTFRDSKWYTISYSKGKLVTPTKQAKAPKLPHGIKPKKGTIVCFKPDSTLFAKGSKLDMKDVISWCKLNSYLIPKLEVKLTDSKGKTKTFISKNGVSDYIQEALGELGCETFGKTFSISTKSVDVAIAFSNAEGINLNAYTNGLLNVDGGEHIKATLDAMVAALKPYKGKLEYTPTDLKEGLVGLVNAKLAAPKFSNQRKDALIDDRIYEPVYEQAFSGFEGFFKSNKKLAQEIVSRAAELRKRTADFLKDKKLIKNVREARKGIYAKLADVQGKAPVEKRELFIVEGDSAGGGMKRARDKSYQAVFPLKGKPLNVMETTKDKINSNAEIAGLFATLGLDLSKPNPLASIRYGKIIIASDADVDGEHISTLLMGLFYKYLPSLIKEGRFYILKSPEYKCIWKGKTYLGFSKKELYEKTGSKKIPITHLKGLGELQDVDLRTMAMDPKTRKMVKILPCKTSSEKKRFEALLSKDPSYRKKLLGLES